MQGHGKEGEEGQRDHSERVDTKVGNSVGEQQGRELLLIGRNRKGVEQYL